MIITQQLLGIAFKKLKKWRVVPSQHTRTAPTTAYHTHNSRELLYCVQSTHTSHTTPRAVWPQQHSLFRWIIGMFCVVCGKFTAESQQPAATLFFVCLLYTTVIALVLAENFW